MAKAAKKQCYACKQTLPLSDFHKSKGRKDGHEGKCKTCRAASYSESNPKKGQGVETWDQLEGLVRGMAETQAAIELEEAACESRIALARKNCRETAAAWKSRIGVQSKLIEAFLKKECERTEDRREIQSLQKSLRFGMISYHRGNLEMTFNTKKAIKLQGKP